MIYALVGFYLVAVAIAGVFGLWNLMYDRPMPKLGEGLSRRGQVIYLIVAVAVMILIKL
jgi:hypothetical protein